MQQLGKHQNMIARALESSLLSSGLFVEVGLAEKDSQVYIAAVPRYVYEDMAVGDDDPENITYVQPMPGELSITSMDVLQRAVITMGQLFMLKLTAGNRVLLFENKRRDQKQKEEEKPEDE